MRAASVFTALLACFLGSAVSQAANPQEKSLTKAAQLFGEPLNKEDRVYPLNQSYVIWLLFDTHGELFEVVVGPKSDYKVEFPDASLVTEADHLTKTEYEETLRRISQLQDIGKLPKEQERPVSGDFGALNTGQFDRASVDRAVADDARGEVKKFNLYFFQDESGSPEQVETVQGQPMVCLGGVWCYVKPDTESEITLGHWQSMQVAGPHLHGRNGCSRTAILHGADGFTIEEPQNETVVAAESYRVPALEGRVTSDD
jgi:hypothetical protein